MLPIRAAVKSLRRSPGFATVSILSLGLSLGLVAAVFGLVDGLRNPRTATRDPEQLYQIGMRGEGAAGRITAADHIDMLERFAHSATAITFATFERGELTANGVLIESTGLRVSSNYFAVRGVTPIAGRAFSAATAAEDAAGSVVISERIWQQEFEGNPRLDRLSVRIDDATGSRRAQVVGVMPQELAREVHAQYWLALPPNIKSHFANERVLFAFTRLKPGTTAEAFNEELRVATTYLTTLHGTGRLPFAYTAKPLTVDRLQMDQMSWLLVGAALAVLMIACSNLANLVLSRGLVRRNELAVRLSLGATRRDIIAGVLAECLVVSLAGAVLGILAAAWGFSMLRANMPERIPTGMLVIHTNWRVIAMSSGAAIVSALAFGLLPALRLSDIQLAQHIKEHSGSTTGRRNGRFPILVVGQVALSLAMLTGVALLLRASQVVSKLDFGFDPGRVLTVMVGSRSRADTALQTRLAMWSATETRLRMNPRAEMVAWQSGVSISRPPSLTVERSGGGFRSRYFTHYTYASPNILRTIGVPVIRGRDFEDHDAFGDGVVVIDSATALKLWGSDDPIGKLVKFSTPERISPWFRVVGIARTVLTDVPTQQGIEPSPKVWLVGKAAFVQPAEPGQRRLIRSVPNREFVVRTTLEDAAVLRNEFPRTVRDGLPAGGYVRVFGWDDTRRELIAGQKFLASVFGTFGVLSLALCALGLYSVLSYAVSQRMREVGVRIALGATPRRIFLDVLHDGAVLVIAGTAVGGLVTIWSNKLVDEFIGILYHIDPWALVGAEFVLVSVAMAAMFRPALRATKTDPVEILRAA
jgi:putative ABC transport system permease protein